MNVPKMRDPIVIPTPAGVVTIERCRKCKGNRLGVKGWKGCYSEPIWGPCKVCQGKGYTEMKWEPGAQHETAVEDDWDATAEIR